MNVLLEVNITVLGVAIGSVYSRNPGKEATPPVVSVQKDGLLAEDK